MARDSLDAQSILTYQLKPALALNSLGTVLAANDGGIRLISPIPSPLAPYCSLIGSNIAELGIVLLPGAAPVLRTWEHVLDAAVQAANFTLPTGEKSNVLSQQPLGKDQFQDTEDFWNHEAELGSIIESEVYITRHHSHVGATSDFESNRASGMIKARATTRSFRLIRDGIFIVTFDRPSSLKRRTEPSASSESQSNRKDSSVSTSNPSRCSCSCHTSPKTLSVDLYQNLRVEDLMPSALEVAASIIPYIMAITDTDGQILKLSDSWYRLTGLEETDSLGSQWAGAMHPDDLPGITSSWADVLRTSRSNWTYETRFRMADGSYRWFLVRTQPDKDENGVVRRWCGSVRASTIT